MSRTSFSADWTFRRDADSGDVTEHAVRLPHDAMLVEGRSASAPSGPHGGHFLGGRYVYTKRWTPSVGSDSRHLSLVFEGVQGVARVLVNGNDVGGSVNGYTDFEVDLDSALVAGENLIEVRVDNTAQPNSRWYTGSGIYRPVWLRERGDLTFAHDGVRLTTTIEAGAVELELEFDVAGQVPEGAEVRLALSETGRVVAEGSVPVRHRRVRVVVPDARTWTADDPYLYEAAVQLVSGDDVLDQEVLAVGLRTVEVVAGRGLLVNGAPTLLKGTCIHHDSGVLGAATFRAAEFRRARILKENGFNAIRSAHNPISRDMLDACDELGLYVMDELTDVWTAKKTDHDGAQYFPRRWRDDMRAMIAKDRNRASVIMYSIGNEIGETATDAGVQLTQEMAGFARELDATRPVTEAINFLVNLMASFNVSTFDTVAEREEKAKRQTKETAKGSSTAANGITNKIGGLMSLVAWLPRSDKYSRRSFSHVDVAGYNYAASRYTGDAKRHPGRIIVGSETMPGDIAKNWAKVEQLPNLIGDFSWTGWDYLGEAGLGSWAYGEGASLMNQPYPHVLAGSGVIDITGVPGGAALLGRAVWGELTAPGVAVRPLDRAGQRVARSAWRSTDSIESWSWRGKAGTTAEIEVYTDADDVELLLNGRSLGRKPAGPRHGYLARFRTPYEPGTLSAVIRRDGVERCTVLRSAGADLRLALVPESSRLVAGGDDLAFVHIEVADADGVVEMLADDEVSIEVHGAGTLAACGSAAPVTTESYLDTTTSTHYGRALAVIRSGERPGVVTVTATSARLGTATIQLAVDPATDDWRLLASTKDR